MIPLGVTLCEGGVTCGVVSANATAIEFCVFDGETEHRHRLTERTGDIWHGFIPGIGRRTRYGLRAHGPWAPHEGHRFNPAKLLLDPYAREIDSALRLHPAMFGHRDAVALLPDDTDSAPFMAKAIVTDPQVAASAQITPWSRTVIYELHVRGFTMLHPEVPPALRGTFAGLAHPAVIAHLVGLGVTAVELLPTAAWIEERHLKALGLQNYWGYNSVGFLAPDPRLAPGGWAEVRAAVAALAAAGIETLLDVVLNHTGEGDALGPTLSMRGLDNAGYYRLPDQARDRYIDDTGCGNTLALDRPPMLDLAMDSLRAWALWGGVHGFRFDLAATLGRRPEGFDVNAPLLTAISQDPLLRGMKLIAEPWDIGPGGYQMGRFPPAWGEWNDRFRDDVRAFWRGDGGKLGALATRLAGSADLFAARRRPSRGVNFITAHDGFTLADLVSHTDKHNEANGEGNRDGTGNNLSWNNGVEGPTTDHAILAARLGDQKALLATLLLARGTPMLSMGAEFGQSQGGNNNAYAQDNETAWLDWNAADPALQGWTRTLIAARASHAALREDAFLTGEPGENLLADVAWLRPDGAAMREADWSGDALLMLLSTEASRVCVAVNRGRESLALVLPPPCDGFVWQDLTGTAGAGTLPARAVALLAEVAQPGARRSPAGPETLARLAAAAGIAPEWWEVDGTHHQVSPDTLRALLAAMHLPAGTGGEARDSLAALAAQGHRPLPAALVTRAFAPAALVLPLEPGLSRRPVWLSIQLADGSTRRHRIGAEDGTLADARGADGRRFTGWHVSLQSLPVGRHTIWRDDAPELTCALTIAPSACHLPAALRAGQRRFGVAAQLYSLRSAGDQGIGDFSTLRALGVATAAAGGAAIGLNPLHMLFPADRARASPYHPSDRRFLDPIYLDLATLDDGLGASSARATIPASGVVEYPKVWAQKSAFLQSRFAAFAELVARHPSAPIARDFAAFIERGGRTLRGFATFQVIAEQHEGQTWPLWPVELRDPTSADVAEIAARHPERLRYHAYLQWLCDRQLARAARESGLEIGLIRDLAVGSAPDGAEAWAGAGLLARGVSIGAPPDPFSAEGQVWNLPPPIPHCMTEDGYAGFADLLDNNLRHAGGLRIDHVMGLARLFWVPDGARGRDGAYVAAPVDDLLGQLALASTQAGALIVGEDLGTVPEGLREKLDANGILSYRVLLLERQGIGFKQRQAYPARAMACVSTHDLPTIAGWWQGADIAEREGLGLIEPAAAESARADRQLERAALSATLGLSPSADLPEIATAAHGFIAATEADLAMVQIDDLALEPVAVNLPGTDTERPNWRRRLAMPVPDLLETAGARAILRACSASGRQAMADSRLVLPPEAAAIEGPED